MGPLQLRRLKLGYEAVLNSFIFQGHPVPSVDMLSVVLWCADQHSLRQNVRRCTRAAGPYTLAARP